MLLVLLTARLLLVRFFKIFARSCSLVVLLVVVVVTTVRAK